MTKPFTLRQAADELGIGKTKLIELLREHPYYYANGNRKLFTQGDIEALRGAMRKQGGSSSKSRGPTYRFTDSNTRARQEEEAYRQAMELATRKKRSKDDNGSGDGHK